MIFGAFLTPVGVIGLIVMGVIIPMSEKIEANVIGYEKHINKDGTPMYSIQYEFTHEGKSYTETSNFSSSEKKLQVNDNIKIVLFMNKPERNGLYGFQYNFLPFVIVTVIGLVSIITYRLTKKHLTIRST